MNLLSFKTVIRLFYKHKLIYGLCIVGLGVGFAVFITTFMHYEYEHSYDDRHASAQDIYRMHAVYGTNDGYLNTYATSDNGYGPALKEELPEVLDYVRVLTHQSERVVSYTPSEGKVRMHRELNVFKVDANFFEFFDYALKSGSKDEVLKEPYTIVLSETAVQKYFHGEDPVGKRLTISDYGEPFDCLITGVFYDLPENSNLQFDFLMSLASQKQRWPWLDESWNYAISYTYLHLQNGVDPKGLTDKIMDVFFDRSGVSASGDLIFDMELAHFPTIHLDEPLQWEIEKKGNRTETQYLLIIGIIILLISWLNYTNISASLALERTSTLRIKTILGAGRLHLLGQLVIEAFLINVMALIIAIVLIYATQSIIVSFFGYEGLAFILDHPRLPFLLISIVLVGTLSTSGISAIISSVNRASLFSTRGNEKTSKLGAHRVMVITQFTATVILLVGTITVYKQIAFMRSQELGVDLGQTIIIKSPMSDGASQQGLDQLRQTLFKNHTITHVSAGSDVPGQFINMGYMIDRTSLDPPVHEITDGGLIDAEYAKTLGLTLVAGEDFDSQSNTEHKVLINEEMSHLLKFENPRAAVGQRIKLPEIHQDQPVTIIGVLQNYRQQSPNHPYRPVFFFNSTADWARYEKFIVRYNGYAQEVLAFLDEQWSDAFPESSFDYYFLNDQYEKQYSGNYRFGKLFGTLCCLAIFISILGLLGSSIYAAHQRTKEIAIRKVSGAQVHQILLLLNRSFTMWAVIAIVIGSCIAYVLMSDWLRGFALQTRISWWVFGLAGLITLSISLLTVTWKSWEAAIKNPIEGLKND